MILIFIFLGAVILSDVSKSLQSVVCLPKLPAYVTTHAIHKKFNLSLYWTNKIRHLVVIAIAILFSFLANSPFNGLHVGALISFMLFGYFVKFIDPVVKSTYNKIIS